jgi:hypothetical protein
LWCMAQLSIASSTPAAVSTDPNAPPNVEKEPTSNFAFMHFDGISWQVLPNGIHNTLFDPNADANGIDITDTASGIKYIAQYNTAVLALVGYSTSMPLQRRYQPLRYIR